ncbi:MAG: hypothetical protein GEU75_04990 [Dehalococcoidia bacterium]|nr:hypothetical protein [Dehalococcoidia bacterium]
MAEVDLRLFIDAPPERVWEIISDLSGQERWMEDVACLDIVSEVKNGQGAVLDLTSQLFGLPLIHDVMEITKWDAPRELGVVHRGQFTGTAYFRLDSASGGTIFTWFEEFEPPLGPLGELGFALLVGPHLRRVWSKSMRNVKRLAEAGASETAAP